MKFYFISIIVAFFLGVFAGATFSDESDDNNTTYTEETYTQEDIDEMTQDMQYEHERELEERERELEEEYQNAIYDELYE